jgi:diguanylate cyclase (GGDEF)-like protein
MARKVAGQQEVSYLIATGFLLILIFAIGFGSAIVYSMARLQAGAQEAYVQPLALSNAGLDAHAALARLHNHMLKILAAGKPGEIAQQEQEMLALDVNLREDISIIRSAFSGEAEEIAEIEHLLDDWQDIRRRLVDLARHGHRDQALKFAMDEGMSVYSRLVSKVDTVVASSRQRAEAVAENVESRSAGIIRMAWWFLGGLVAATVLCGVMVSRKVRRILEHDRQTAKQLHENEERLKLALSGAEEGTWDLDLVTGRLNFDSQWGAMLEYVPEKERPHYFEDWAALIHAEDRERVLKAMHDHVEGWTSEYKAEYRIRSGSGAWRWVAGHGRAVSRGPDGKALRVVGVTRDVTMKKQAEERIWQLAHSDFLTGLHNRISFYDRLGQSISQAKRHNQKLALLFLDLDGFKQINDRFGHDTGDALLQEVAERLRQNMRGEDTVARTGGDEFMFILNDVSRAANAAIVAQKIIHSLAEPFVIHGNTCRIGGSIGIAIFPDDSDNMEALVTLSDDAMYKAKEKGKGNYQFFAAAPDGAENR